ncbi:MAG: ABC transporter ATP-binding protein, partial [Candidatus Omnitrophica bacterium]|nr:ABC transporter ATP-binding protein [Candidatus Omnitrophota bacterium]
MTIVAQKISKSFGTVEVLKDISFKIEPGEIIGFLGRNGAGKTTLMRVLTTYLRTSKGQITFDGLDLFSRRLQIRRKIGYLPETPPLYPQMLVKDYIRYAAQLKDVPVKELTKQVERVMDICQLNHVQTKMIGILSKGFKQRVGIAQAIVNDPQVLILDEPTNGLDPVQVQHVRGLIKSL